MNLPSYSVIGSRNCWQVNLIDGVSSLMIFILGSVAKSAIERDTSELSECSMRVSPGYSDCDADGLLKELDWLLITSLTCC